MVVITTETKASSVRNSCVADEHSIVDCPDKRKGARLVGE